MKSKKKKPLRDFLISDLRLVVFHQVAIHLMVNQLLGVSSESEVNEMSQLFSDFVDGCLSVPIDLPGFTYHKAMKVSFKQTKIKLQTSCSMVDLPFWTLFAEICLFLVQARKEIIRKINKTIEKRLQNKEASDTAGNGVLGRLLEEESLPNESMADFIINLLFAGNETTSKTMLFAVYFLTHCPKAMTQLLVHINPLQ